MTATRPSVPVHRSTGLSPARLGALLGGAGMVGYPIGRFGPPAPDAFEWFLWLLVVAFGAGLGLGLGLAYANIRRSPWVLRWSAVLLVPLSLWILWSHEAERRAVPSLRANADSVQAVVLGRNIFGNLLLHYPHRGGRGVAPRKYAHARYAEDSIWVYVDPQPPHRVLDVWPAGPDLLITLRWLLWLWLAGLVMLAGYLPSFGRWLRGPHP